MGREARAGGWAGLPVVVRGGCRAPPVESAAFRPVCERDARPIGLMLSLKAGISSPRGRSLMRSFQWSTEDWPGRRFRKLVEAGVWICVAESWDPPRSGDVA